MTSLSVLSVTAALVLPRSPTVAAQRSQARGHGLVGRGGSYIVSVKVGFKRRASLLTRVSFHRLGTQSGWNVGTGAGGGSWQEEG